MMKFPSHKASAILSVFLGRSIVISDAYADWSATLTGATDYTLNGVSQTQNDPALQGSIDWSADNGFYAGGWTSDVDYGESADREADLYLGYYTSLTDALAVDYGLIYYSYHGGDASSDFNYVEAYGSLGYASSMGTTDASFWFAWDYFGTGANHIIGKLAHTVQLAENHAIQASIDASHSLDSDKYQWDVDDSSYVHYRLAYQTSLAGFDIELAAEDTTLSYDTADARIVASVSRTFSF